MLKKMFLGLTVVGLLLAGSLTAAAGEPGGTVRVSLRCGETPVEGASVMLSRAGEAIPEGYLLERRFGGGIIMAEDVFSGDLARWMADSAADGLAAKTDGEGRAQFSGLAYGLYLVTQPEQKEGYQRMEPYLLCVSEELPLADTYPEVHRQNPRTGDPMLPVLAGGSMTASFLLLIFCLNSLRKNYRMQKADTCA